VRRWELIVHLELIRSCFFLLCASSLAINAFAQNHTPPKAKIAVVGGQSIDEDDWIPLVQSQLLRLHNQECALKNNALERLIGQKLLEAETKKKGLTAEKLIEQAKKLGVDDKKFDACLVENKYKDQVEQDGQDGRNAGVSGTPALFANGIFLSGAQPASAFAKIIDEELAALKQ
jgi:hypothetical protein